MKLYFWNKDTLDMEKIPLRNLIFIVVSTLLISTLSTVISYHRGFEKGKKAEILEKDVIVLYQEIEKSSFTRRNFYEYLKKINIKFPELVFAQAIKESGFKSYLWENNNNPFGMKDANKRPNMQNGTQDGYGYYDTWKDAALDYAFYQCYVGLSRLRTQEEYLECLKRMNYYDTEHPANATYLTDLKTIADNIEDYFIDDEVVVSDTTTVIK